MIRRFRSKGGGDPEAGIAMVMVLGITTVVTLLAASMVAYSLGSHRNARADQDWNAALSAAYAGIEEYQSRLANDPGYYTLGNPASTFSSDSSSVVTMPTGSAENPAFSLTSWADIPGSTGAASFRYEVDNSDYFLDGTLRLRSTGRAGGDTRSIVADLRQRGFIDFLYFTDYEIQDPVLSGADVTDCVKYAHGTSPRLQSSNCSEIAFGSSDVLNGPVHSNDAIRACQATFNGQTTTAYSPATGDRYKLMTSNGSSCSASTFAVNGSGPAFQATIGMPQTNSELRKETRGDLPLIVPRPGCLYTGPTTFTLMNDGTMRVVSPWTQYTSASPTAANNAGCGTPGSGGLGATTGSGSSQRYVGQVIAVPDSNVAFVQNVPSVSSDPNYAPAGRTPVGTDQVACANDESNNVGYPYRHPTNSTYHELTPLASTATNTAYGCRNGDAFVSGELDGKLTIASENYIYATGDIEYEDPQIDLLGLVGNNAVFVWNPTYNNGGYYDSLLTDWDRRIDAAILSVGHTFQVQNYSRGDNRGTLTINGAIAQRFRGVVRSGSRGYAKNYMYDERYRYTAPPKFLSPVTSTYGVSVWAETKPVFDVDGNYR